MENYLYSLYQMVLKSLTFWFLVGSFGLMEDRGYRGCEDVQGRCQLLAFIGWAG
jgi:hypothetical protein